MKKTLKDKKTQNNDNDYLLYCNSLSPAERILKGFELSEWAISINKYIDSEIKKRLDNHFCLI